MTGQGDHMLMGDMPSPSPVSDYEKIKRIGEVSRSHPLMPNAPRDAASSWRCNACLSLIRIHLTFRHSALQGTYGVVYAAKHRKVVPLAAA